MTDVLRRLRGVAIALVTLALTAGIAFAAQPPAASWGLSNASTHAGKTVPVGAGDEESSEDEDTDETEEDVDAPTDETSENGGENCATDPTTLTDEELAAMRHGSIVCWAAHQTTWPEEFKSHGAWVSSWAHSGKDAEEETGAASAGKGHGKGQEKKQ